MHTAERDAASGIQERVVRLQEGYTPATVRVKAGRPVRLVFDRQEVSGCSEVVSIAVLGVRTELPPFQTTVVEFTPGEPGRYTLTCGMGIDRGEIIAA
jgi:plastocyanin domain-containing protein